MPLPSLSPTICIVIIIALASLAIALFIACHLVAFTIALAALANALLVAHHPHCCRH
jgi:hypothetical protein